MPSEIVKDYRDGQKGSSETSALLIAARIRLNPSLSTDLFDPASDRRYSERLTAMVVLTQVAGLCLIYFGLAQLTSLPDFQERARRWTIILGVIFTAVAFLACWYDAAGNLLAGWIREDTYFEDMSEPKRKTFVMRATMFLVIADTFLLSILIIVTGGLGGSPLDPLLPTIPIIAIILRQPKRTVFISIGLGLFFALGPLLFWVADKFEIEHYRLPESWIFDAHSDPRYSLAFATVFLGAVGLSLLEYLVTHRPPPVARGLKRTVQDFVDDNSVLRKVYRPVKQGTWTWLKWLGHRDLPLGTLSLVHEEQDVIKQAIVLSAPYWFEDLDWVGRWRTRRITRHITFLTFAVHWIDDHFDALQIYCPDHVREEVRNSSPEDILNRQNKRLDELMQRMTRAVERDNRDQVKRAVVRIIYGGLIQNAQNEVRLKQLLSGYVEHVSEGLSDSLRKTYSDLLESNSPLSVWVTAKVVIELLEACDRNFSPDQAEILNLLYGPLLYYQNRSDEVALESFGLVFGKTFDIVHESLPTEADMLGLIKRAQALMKQVMGTEELPLSRRMQLKLLLNLYGSKLPESLLRAYQRLCDPSQRPQRRLAFSASK